MNGLASLVLYLFGAMFMTHELDAIHKHEWRLLYVLRSMPDEVARRWFIALHVPLFTIILWLFAHANTIVGFWSIIALDVFAIIHAGLHLRLSSNEKYEFHTLLSKFFIFGTAVLGGVHLLLLWFVI